MNSTATSPSSTVRSRGIRLGAAAVLAGGLVLAAPLAANAHVGVTPDSAEAGASSVLTFSFSHGCDDSPTTALVFDVPEGVQSVTPTLTPGWTITTEQGANESVTQVTYTADEPVPSGVRAALELSVRFTEDAANSSVAFPVTQVCETGETAWIEVADEGVDPETLESPAPVVAVGDVSAEGEHGHGGGEAATDEHADADDHADASSTSTSDPLPLVIGGLGLGVGVIALIVALIAVRSARKA